MIIHTTKNDVGNIDGISNIISDYITRRNNKKKTVSNLEEQLDYDTDALREFYKTVNQQGYSNDLLRTTMEGASDAAKDYAAQMEHGKGSVEDFVKSQNKAIQSLEASTKITTSLKSIGFTALSTVASAGIGLAIGAAISFAIGAIDDLIHEQEIAIEEGEKARNTISEIADEYNTQVSSLNSMGEKFAEDTSSIESTGDALDSIASKYAELSKGVNSLNNENVSLNDDDYQEFLDISNQLADIYPSLVTSYDDNGNAILNLGDNAANAAEKLRDLFEAQQLVAHAEIADNLQTDYEGIVAQDDKYKDNIKELEDNLSDLQEKQKDMSTLSFDGEFGKGITFTADQVEELREITDLLDEYGVRSSTITDTGGALGTAEDITYDLQVSTDINNLSHENKTELKNKIAAVIGESQQILDGEVAKAQQKLDAEKLKQENNWKSIIPDISSFLQTESTFSQADTTLQDAIISQLENLNLSSISSEYDGNIENFLYGEIIQPISELTPEVQSSLAQLFSLDSGSLSLKDYRKSVNDILNSAFGDNQEQKLHWENLLGLDEMEQEYTDKINAMVENSDIGRKQFKSLTGDELEIAYDLIVNDEFSGTFEELQKEIDETEKSVLDLSSHPLFTAAGEALEKANKGEIYSEMLGYIDTMKSLVESGDIGTDDFKTIAAMFSPTGATDYANWQENLSKIERYFTEDNSGVLNFLEDLSEKTNESGEALADFNEKTGEWSFNIDDLEKTAQRMGIGFEPLMALFGELEDKGFYTDFFVTPEEGGKTLSDLTDQLFTAEEELANLKAEDANDSAIEAKKQEIEQLKERIDATKDSLTELLSKNPEEEVEKIKRNTGLLKEQKKSFNQMSKEDEYQTEEGRQTLRTYGTSLVTAAQEMGYENAEIQEVTDKKTGKIRLKLVLEPEEAEQELSEIENEEHETKVKATVDASEIDNISRFISKEDAEKKVVKLIGEDEATPVIENWDKMDPVDKETTLTARDRATATLRMWNAYQVLSKQGVLEGVDFYSWLIDEWNSYTPEQKQAIISADTNEANSALEEVLGLSGDLSNTTASPNVKVDGATTARNQISSVSSALDSLDGKTATTKINTVRTNTTINLTKNKKDKLGNNFNGTFHAYGTMPAHAQGTISSKNVSIRHNEDALINEVGEEGVVFLNATLHSDMYEKIYLIAGNP